jgi:hypothetical protein
MLNKKHTWLRTLGIIGALGCCAHGAAVADELDQRCRDQKINGLYIFSASGFVSIAGTMAPKAIVEMIRFNGDGTLSTPGLTLAVNGNVFRVPVGNSGTYALEASCVGTILFADGIAFDMYATPGGAELSMIQTNTGNVFQGTAKRVSY